jgi:hypothetical protein
VEETPRWLLWLFPAPNDDDDVCLYNARRWGIAHQQLSEKKRNCGRSRSSFRSLA